MSVGHDKNACEEATQTRSPSFGQTWKPLPRELLEFGLCANADWPAGLWDSWLADEDFVERRRRHGSARQVCEECPVRSLCEDYAFDSHAEGVWGGRVFSEYTWRQAALDAERDVEGGRCVGPPDLIVQLQKLKKNVV